MRIERVKRGWLSVGAAVILTAGAAAQGKAQDATVPSGRLVFRSSSLEFRPDGTFLAHTVLDGMGEVRAAGTWSAQPGTIELSRYEVLAGAELLASFSMDGCLATGQYRLELSGKQLRLTALRDGCLPRALFLDKTRWAATGRAESRTATDSHADPVRSRRSAAGARRWIGKLALLPWALRERNRGWPAVPRALEPRDA